MVEKKTTTKKAVETKCSTCNCDLMASATILAALIQKGASGHAAIEATTNYLNLLKSGK